MGTKAVEVEGVRFGIGHKGSGGVAVEEGYEGGVGACDAGCVEKLCVDYDAASDVVKEGLCCDVWVKIGNHDCAEHVLYFRAGIVADTECISLLRKTAKIAGPAVMNPAILSI